MGKKARNGQGTIKSRQLADGTVVWDAWASVKDPITGKTSRPSKRGLESDTAAVEWIQTQRASKRRASGMTLDDMAEIFWGADTVKDTTISHWRSWYEKDIKPYLGAMPIRDILPMHIDQWVIKIRAVKYKGELRAPTTLVNRVSVLSAILQYAAVAARVIDADWTKVSGGVRKLREDANNYDADRLIHPKDRWTVKNFVDFLAMETESSYRALWCFMAATGVRRGTALGLKWEDIDFERKRIVARLNRTVTPDGIKESTQKGGRKIVLHIDELLEKILLEQKARQDREREAGPWEETGVVFDRPILRKSHKGVIFLPGIPMNPGSVTERFGRLAKYAELPPATPHDLRHMWATMARDLGATRDAVGDQLGQRSKAVTRIYDHSENERTSVAAAIAQQIIAA